MKSCDPQQSRMHGKNFVQENKIFMGGNADGVGRKHCIWLRSSEKERGRSAPVLERRHVGKANVWNNLALKNRLKLLRPRTGALRHETT